MKYWRRADNGLVDSTSTRCRESRTMRPPRPTGATTLARHRLCCYALAMAMSNTGATVLRRRYAMAGTD
eukprot:588298-Rhodomonas_salina.2